MIDPQLPPPSGAVVRTDPVVTSAPLAAPPGAYLVPVGGYLVPFDGYAAPETKPRRSGLLGMIALLMSVAAAVICPIVMGIAGFAIGRQLPKGDSTTNDQLLSALSPVREQVLHAEIAFWSGTVLGVAALVIGIMAIARRQGRGPGIGAVVVAVLAPGIVAVVAVATLSAGGASGLLELMS